jgi:hypothetical protein
MIEESKILFDRTTELGKQYLRVNNMPQETRQNVSLGMITVKKQSMNKSLAKTPYSGIL